MSIAHPLPELPPLISRSRGQLLCGIVAAEVLVLCIPWIWWGYAVVGTAVFLASLGLLLSVVRNRATGVILGWVLMFPLGYYYASFPKEESLVTSDRIFIGILLVAACWAGSGTTEQIPADLRKSAKYWGGFVLVAALTIPRVKLPLSALRILVEAFVFPGLLAWYVVRYFDVRKNLPRLHLVASVMAIYVAVVGAAEVVLQRDLMALPSSSIILAGEDPTAQFWLRPNGPFTSTNSFALIGWVSFFFLLFLRKAMAEEMPVWQMGVHRLAVACALLTSFMPLFRSVITSVVVVLAVDAYYTRGLRRLIRVGAISSFLLLALVLRLALPAVFEDRSSSANFEGRIATQLQVLKVFLDNPLTGVGLTNYAEAARNGRYASVYQDVEAVDAEHNNLSAVLAETGIVGFLFYLISQVLLVTAFRRVSRPRTQESMLVWKAFLFIFLAYWINGMSVISGFYSDLNLWYLFALAVVYKFALTQPRQTASVASLV
jgi:hypothetical protein